MELTEMIAADPLRFAVITSMGTALVATSMVGGYRVAYWLGIDRSLGALAGIAVGVAGLIYWLPPL